MFLYDGMIKDSTTAKALGERANRPHATPSGQALEDLLYSVGQTGDKQAFIQVFEYFAPRVKSFLIKRGASPEAADELAQDTMLTLWDKAAGYDPAKARASTWIYTIARNKHIDSLRKNAPQYPEPADMLQLESSAPGPGENLMRREETDAIAQAIEKLPQEQADLLRKSFFEGKSHGEIAAETKIPLGTIKSRIRMALERLRGEETVKALR